MPAGIVEADDTHLLGDVDACHEESLNDSEGEPIVEGRDRGWQGPTGQDRLGRADAVGLLKASWDDDCLPMQAVHLHRLEIAVASFAARRGGPAVDVHDPSVPKADEMVDRHDDAALVVDANDVDARAGQRACDGDDGDLVRQHS